MASRNKPLHASDLTLEMIDEFLKPIGKPQTQLKLLPPLATGGRGFISEEALDENDEDTYYVPFSQRHHDRATAENAINTSYMTQYNLEDTSTIVDDENSIVGSAMSQIESVTTFDMTPSIRGIKSKLLKQNNHNQNSNNNNNTTATNLEDIKEISESMTSLNQMKYVEQDLHVYETYNFHEGKHVYDKRMKITQHANAIVELVGVHSVCIIQGGTGCGKTTQVPQYILDDHAKYNKYCNIIVTQPRRIAAISVAMRVCNERNWTLGSVCGYQIGLDNKHLSEDTRISYVTTGILLQKLINPEGISRYTHIIIDEVHERDLDVDFTLLVLKLLMKSNIKIKVILMSATIDCARFSKYFNCSSSKMIRDAPVFHIEGQTYKVQEYYLEDLQEMRLNRGFSIPDFDSTKPDMFESSMNMVIELLQLFDEEEKRKIQAMPNSSARIISGVAEFRGSVLIFVPGMRQIQDLEQLLRKKLPNNGLNILPLHSDIVIDQQKRAFEPQQATKRKVIISTSIAESSITVPDIKYVIDFCLTKELWCDPYTNYTHLRMEWATTSSLNQRKGRAGRVSDGACYRLITRRFMDQLDEQPIPQILRQPLSKLILNVKRLKLQTKHDPKRLLAFAMQPPNLDDIDRTILLLKEAGALTIHPNAQDGDLTYVGNIMGQLPVDIHLTKLIMLGHTFGKLRECIIIAAALSTKTFFTRYIYSNLESFKAKWFWASGSFCDCLAILHAYNTWEDYQLKGKFQYAKDMEAWARSNMIDLYRIREVRLLKEEIEKRLKLFNIECNRTANEERRRYEGPSCEDDYDIDDENDVERHHLILKVIIAGAFYPNYFTSTVNDEYDAYKMVSGKDIRQTVMVKGLPMGQGVLYHDKILDMFKMCSRNIQIHYEDSKAYLQFKSDFEEVKTNVSFGVYVAVQMRQLRIPLEIPRFNEMVARRLIDNINKLRQSERNSSLMIQNVEENIVYKYSNNYQSDEEAEEDVQVSKVSLVSSSRQFRSFIMTPTSNRLAEYLSNPEYLLNKEREFGIGITELIECGHFWAQINEKAYVTTLSNIQSKLNTGQYKLNTINSINLYVGMLVVAPYRDEVGETFLYRAKVTHVDQDSQLADLMFVDYGNKQSKKFSQIYVLTDELQKYPFQAIECKLANIKINKLKCPNGVWSRAATDHFVKLVLEKQLKASVFSIIDNVVRVQLTSKGSHVTINDELVKSGFALAAEESTVSHQRHMELYLSSYQVTPTSMSTTASILYDENNNYDDVATPTTSNRNSGKKKNENIIRDLNDSLVSLNLIKDDDIGGNKKGGLNRDDPNNYSGTLKLTGPHSPLEVTYHPIVNIGKSKSVRVARDSINFVCIDDDPQNEFERMIIASEVTLNHTGNGVILRGTTLLPKIRGLASILCLLFTPKCEVRLSADKKSYTGALCGLGCDRHTKVPLYVDNDIECTFDVKISFQEFKMINTVRMAMNMIIGSDEEAKNWTTEPRLLRHLQQKACNRLLELIEKERTPIEPVYFHKFGRWNQIKDDHILETETGIKFEKNLYTSHCVAVLQDDLEYDD